MNIVKDLVHYLSAKFFDKPFFCHFYVTSICDLRCKQCCFPEDFNRIDVAKRGNLNVDEIEAMARHLKAVGVHNILLSGGEPFSRQDLPEIVAIFVKNGFSVRVVTNGSFFVTEERIQSVIDAGVDAVQVSFDSLNPDIHDAITQRQGSWALAKRTLEYAAGHLKKGMACAITVVSSQNIRELPALAEYTTSIGAYSIFQPVHLATDENASGMLGMSHEEQMQIGDEQREVVGSVYEKLIAMKKQGFNILSSNRFMRDSVDYFCTGKKKWSCDAYRYYVTVCPHGGVLPCLRFEDTDWLDGLNILDDNFVKMFLDRRMRNKAGAYRSRCPGCVLSCYREMSYLFHSPGVMLEMAHFIAMKKTRASFIRNRLFSANIT